MSTIICEKSPSLTKRTVNLIFNGWKQFKELEQHFSRKEKPEPQIVIAEQFKNCDVIHLEDLKKKGSDYHLDPKGQEAS